MTSPLTSAWAKHIHPPKGFDGALSWNGPKKLPPGFFGADFIRTKLPSSQQTWRPCHEWGGWTTTLGWAILRLYAGLGDGTTHSCLWLVNFLPRTTATATICHDLRQALFEAACTQQLERLEATLQDTADTAWRTKIWGCVWLPWWIVWIAHKWWVIDSNRM
jgi:hypothetical protein